MRFQDPMCLHDDLFSYIHQLLKNNSSSSAESSSNESCGFESRDSGSSRHQSMKSDLAFLHNCKNVYAYLTPIIILIGIVGNSISLRVFCSQRMRKMSASIYLASLAISDTCVLLSYVLIEWLHRGMNRWPPGLSIDLTVLHPGTTNNTCTIINARNISLYTRKRNIEELAHRKKQESQKVILFSSTLTHSQCDGGAISPSVIFAVFDVRVAVNKCINWCFVYLLYTRTI